MVQDEIVCLIGANDADKSTLLGAVSGLIKPSAGTIELEGWVTVGQKAYRLSRQGLILVPEGWRVLANLSVEENLILGGYFRSLGREQLEDLEEVYAISLACPSAAGNRQAPSPAASSSSRCWFWARG
ncbi:hypothetical protein DFAR_2230011 [Desulfarculales bacterium]